MLDAELHEHGLLFVKIRTARETGDKMSAVLLLCRSCGNCHDQQPYMQRAHAQAVQGYLVVLLRVPVIATYQQAQATSHKESKTKDIAIR